MLSYDECIEHLAVQLTWLKTTLGLIEDECENIKTKASSFPPFNNMEELLAEMQDKIFKIQMVLHEARTIKEWREHNNG